MPGFNVVHTLSISQEAITALSFNQRGDWLAIGSAALGQLLVWEWRSETYILKQQGHYHDISTVAYSPDGAYIATGAEDAKVSSTSHTQKAPSPPLASKVYLLRRLRNLYQAKACQTLLLRTMR